MTQQKDSAPQWILEELYFGNATYPSWTTYRRCGDRVQIQAEHEVKVVNVEINQLQFNLDQTVCDSINTLQECSVTISKGNITYDDVVIEPRAWLKGWRDVTAPEELRRYEEDRRLALNKPAQQL